ncbi:hypothetical protein [Alicyclobacillus fodiniaquatilis]|uniref:CN hydrolase domain-containing protein n=1 Tax=Alicyclobacillus fodiniaquatilis TaxID=1661150 RepID=A0ABW4JBT5_9BACL
MRILVCQPIHETGTTQLEDALSNHSSLDWALFPEGYIANEGLVQDACNLARKFGVGIITGYRDKNQKDRALVIDKIGKVILERAKSPMGDLLFSPSRVESNGVTIGYLLCVELLQGFEGFGQLGINRTDFVAHPIGVGMFSDEQFNEWITEAKRIAIEYRTMIIGASHADGSYRNCGISIPIAYCIGSDGQEVFVSKDDVRPIVLDTEHKSIEMRQSV